MRLPRLTHPQRYAGLYVFDFGQRVAVGYTADEIQVLQASPEHGHGRAFKIMSASEEGQVMLRGVEHVDTSVEEGMIFLRDTHGAATEDFQALAGAAQRLPPPCVVHWQLGRRPATGAHFTLLRYEVEHSESVGRWLQDLGFNGGTQVECGRSVVAQCSGPQVHEERRLAIAPRPQLRSRPRWEVLDAVDRPVQREL